MPAACVAMRRDEAAGIARAGGLEPRRFDTGTFVLAGWQRPGRAPGGVLTVYLEGDGRAYATPTRVADDPTPSDPVALPLAAADPAPAVLYLARPCQYVEGPDARNCAPYYWSTGRFAPEVVAATMAALDAAKAASGGDRLELIGYSGGGALAVLVAARRQDVARLVTVAANLALAAWIEHHHVSPMTGSLDPLDDAAAVARVPQLHYAGAADETVPPGIVERFARAVGPDIPVVVVSDYSHHCCWAANWLALLARARAEARP
jgi:pimeloyl-ACP methyl ester carboxylesterase